MYIIVACNLSSILGINQLKIDIWTMYQHEISKVLNLTSILIQKIFFNYCILHQRKVKKITYSSKFLEVSIEVSWFNNQFTVISDNLHEICKSFCLIDYEPKLASKLVNFMMFIYKWM